MKQCTKCRLEKSESDFYLDRRSKYRRTETACKKCRSLQANESKKNKPKNKFNSKHIGQQKCRKCSHIKDITEFCINKAIPGGRNKICKDCENNKHKISRRRNGILYKPTNGSSLPNDIYYIGNCEICNSSFTMIRKNHKRCESCSSLVRDIQSQLTSSRSTGVRLKCSPNLAMAIARKHISSICCCYCARPYTNENNKSIDHIIPVVLGGDNSFENLNICCLECNYSKRAQTLENWINQCKLVVMNLCGY